MLCQLQVVVIEVYSLLMQIKQAIRHISLIRRLTYRPWFTFVVFCAGLVLFPYDEIVISVISVYFNCCNLMYHFSPLFFSFPKIIVGETAVFCLQLATKDFENQEKTILTGDCCYINPLVRRTIRFLGMSKIFHFLNGESD